MAYPLAISPNRQRARSPYIAKFPRIGLVFLLFLLPIPGHASEHFPGVAWDRVDAVAAGWSTQKLAKAEAWSQMIGSTAVMIVQHGLVVAEWGDTAAKTPLASVRKSLLSALIGIAIDRHQINLDATLGDLGIDDNAPSLSAEEKTATVRDLLEARSGVYHPALYETGRMAELRPPRFSHKPGRFWYYNNWDFNALGAIYEHAVGSSIYDAFEREIAQPISMEDYRPSDGKHVTGAASVYPAYTFDMSARDLARFALLYLNDGRWHDRQIVPGQWVKDSTCAFSQSGFGPGYGYLWWTGFANMPAGTFFAAGAGGQFAFVMPAYDLVVISRAPHLPLPLASGSEFEGDGTRKIGRFLWLVFDAAGFRNGQGGAFRVRLNQDAAPPLSKGPKQRPTTAIMNNSGDKILSPGTLVSRATLRNLRDEANIQWQGAVAAA
jgi:CubicO group peptidase (beta-lactamase class C family)